MDPFAKLGLQRLISVTDGHLRKPSQSESDYDTRLSAGVPPAQYPVSYTLCDHHRNCSKQ